MRLTFYFTSGAFRTSVGNISDKYFTEVTPASFVFATIWPIIFLWTISGNVYLAASLCLPEERSPVKTQPAITPLVNMLLHKFHFAKNLNNFMLSLLSRKAISDATTI